MKLETEAEQRARARALRRHSAARRTLLTACCAVGGMAGAALALAAFDWSATPRFERVARVVRAPLRFAAARATSDAPPQLVIDQKFKHLHRIHQRRERALREGLLLDSDDDLVPAAAADEHGTAPVRIRLLGGPARAFAGEQWPLWLEAGSDASVLGMRALALRPLAPLTEEREWLAPLRLQHARERGLVAARSRIVSLVWNGQDLGLYAAIEAPTRHLANGSGHESGAIVGWDADEHRSAGACERGALPVDDAFTAPLRVVDSGPDDELALATLRGFLDGRLDASDAFDARAVGSLLAVSALWRGQDALRWSDLTVSFDPVSAKLAPIAGATSSWPVCRSAPGGGRRAEERGALLDHALARHWLADEAVRSHFVRARVQLAREVATTERSRWQQRIDTLTRALHYASPWSATPDGAVLRRRADALALGAPEPRLLLAQAAPLPYASRAVIAREQRTKGAGRIELGAGGEVPIEILTLGTGDGADFAPLALEGDTTFPLRIEPAAAVGPRPLETLRYRLPTALGGAVIHGRARLAGTRDELPFTVGSAVRGLSDPTLASPSIETVLERHPFLRREERPDGSVRLRVPPGTWNVDGRLTTPAGATLVIEAGARLRFEPDGGLLALGAMRVSGTAGLPVVFEGRPSAGGDTAPRDGPPAWAGIAIVTGEGVAWRHAEVRGGRGLTRRQWRSDAALLVRAPRFAAEDVTIHASRADAALHIDRTSAALVRVRISAARADAVRAWHSHVAADGLAVDAAGGRGWAQRGGRASLRASRFAGIAGAAVELARNAHLDAAALEIDRAALGVVARDASSAAIAGGRIGGIEDAALLAFAGSGWAASAIDAEAVELLEPKAAVLAQSGSRIRLDGVAIDAVDADFAGLQRSP